MVGARRGIRRLAPGWVLLSQSEDERGVPCRWPVDRPACGSVQRLGDQGPVPAQKCGTLDEEVSEELARRSAPSWQRSLGRQVAHRYGGPGVEDAPSWRSMTISIAESVSLRQGGRINARTRTDAGKEREGHLRRLVAGLRASRSSSQPR